MIKQRNLKETQTYMYNNLIVSFENFDFEDRSNNTQKLNVNYNFTFVLCKHKNHDR